MPNAVNPSIWDGPVLFLTPTPCQPAPHATHHVRDAQLSRFERGDAGRECAPHIMFSTSNVPVMRVVLQARVWQRDTAPIHERHALPLTFLRLIWDLVVIAQSICCDKGGVEHVKALALTTIVHRKHDGTERVGISHFGASVYQSGQPQLPWRVQAHLAGLAKAAFSQRDDFHQGVFYK